VTEVSSWLLQHGMLRNPAKSEAMLIGSAAQRRKVVPFKSALCTDSIRICGWFTCTIIWQNDLFNSCQNLLINDEFMIIIVNVFYTFSPT